MRGVFKKIFYSSDLAAATAAVSVHGSRLTRSKMVLAQDESIAMGVGVKNVVLNSQGITKKQARTLELWEGGGGKTASGYTYLGMARGYLMQRLPSTEGLPDVWSMGWGFREQD